MNTLSSKDRSPEDFEAHLRAALHSAADPVTPDPAGWRALQARLRRRRAGVKFGGVALAGATVALVAVFAAPNDPGSIVELGDPGVATQPADGSPDEGGLAFVPRGVLVATDGKAIQVSDLSGEELFQIDGQPNVAITDVVVRPGGHVEDFLVAYRTAPADAPSSCGALAWNLVVGRSIAIAGGAASGGPAEDEQAQTGAQCMGAPTFSSDGSAIGYLASGAVDTWSLELGSTENDVLTPMASVDVTGQLSSIESPRLVDLVLGPVPSTGTVSIQGVAADGMGLFEMPIDRTVDGFALDGRPATGPLLVDDTLTLAQGDVPTEQVRLLDRHGDWAVGVRPSDQSGLLLYGRLDDVDQSGRPVYSFSTASDLTWQPGTALTLDVLSSEGGGPETVLVASGPTALADRRTGSESLAIGLPAIVGGALVAESAPQPGLTEEPSQVAQATEGSLGVPPTPPPPVGDVPPSVTIDGVGGIVYSDGDSIHVSDAAGDLLWTPAQGEGTSTITDLAVLPGSRLSDFTMAYRFDVADAFDRGGVPTDCGDISWTHVVGVDNNVAGGGLPGVDTFTSEDCLGAPVFAADGSSLGWFATTTEGQTVLQTIDWTPEGPVDGTLTTIDLASLALTDVGTDLTLLDWGSPLPGGETVISVGATDADGRGVVTTVLGRDADGRLIGLGATLSSLRTPLTGVTLDRLVNVSGNWRVGVRAVPSSAAGEVGFEVIDPEVESGSPASIITDGSYDDLRMGVDGLLFIDAVSTGSTTAAALIGNGSKTALLLLDGSGLTVDPGYPPATTAALLLE